MLIFPSRTIADPSIGYEILKGTIVAIIQGILHGGITYAIHASNAKERDKVLEIKIKEQNLKEEHDKIQYSIAFYNQYKDAMERCVENTQHCQALKNGFEEFQRHYFESGKNYILKETS